MTIEFKKWIKFGLPCLFNQLEVEIHKYIHVHYFINLVGFFFLLIYACWGLIIFESQ